jgi:uncharacterized protein YjiS (DUF1127 family)
MSHNINHTANSSAIAHDVAGDVGRRLMAKTSAMYAAWKEYLALRRDVARLQSMDDRLLQDIGLTRAGIGHAVQFGRYGD